MKTKACSEEVKKVAGALKIRALKCVEMTPGAVREIRPEESAV